MTDVHELDKGMELTRKEFELRKDFKDDKQNVVLKDFFSNADEKLRRLRSEAKAAHDAFCECVEYFGESPRQTDANAFFGLFARFIKTYKVRLPCPIFKHFSFVYGLNMFIYFFNLIAAS